MKTMMIAAALLALAGNKGKDEAKAPDPNAQAAKAHGGKVWVQTDPIESMSGQTLMSWLASHAQASAFEIAKKGKDKDGPWSIQFLAVFKKPAAKGPMTVQISDKTDPKDVIDQFSPENDEATLVFRSSFDLDPDRGFNKGHTYLVKVGQIINKQFIVYASGQVVLK
jgi:hypothetical protein